MRLFFCQDVARTPTAVLAVLQPSKDVVILTTSPKNCVKLMRGQPFRYFLAVVSHLGSIRGCFSRTTWRKYRYDAAPHSTATYHPTLYQPTPRDSTTRRPLWTTTTLMSTSAATASTPKFPTPSIRTSRTISNLALALILTPVAAQCPWTLKKPGVDLGPLSGGENRGWVQSVQESFTQAWPYALFGTLILFLAVTVAGSLYWRKRRKKLGHAKLM